VTSALKDFELFSYRQNFPGIRFISLSKNSGFASTVNVGFRTATTEWLATINDDTFLNSDWIKNALENAPDDAGSVNPIIYSPNGTIESAGIRILSIGKAEPINSSLIEFNRVNSSQRTSMNENQIHKFETEKLQAIKYLFESHDFLKKMNEALAGESNHFPVSATNAAAVIYKHLALEKVGLFDEDFGSYLEDIDLSLRISKKGYSNYVSTKSCVIHQGQSTSSKTPLKKRFYDARNWWYVVFKNWGILQLARYMPFILFERMRNTYGIFKRT
jgi:GT2 family glycosyltransferase